MGIMETNHLKILLIVLLHLKNKEWHNFSHPISDRQLCKFVVLVNDLIYMKVNQHIWIFDPDIGWKQWSFESPKFTGEPYEILPRHYKTGVFEGNIGLFK